MNKKADLSIKTIVTLVILLLSAATATIFAVNISRELKADSDTEVCRLSVLAQAQTRKVTFTEVSAPKTIIPLECPRRIIKIFENKVEVNGKESKKYSFKKISEDDLNYVLSEELRLCWYKLLEGNKDLFEDSLIFSVTDKTCLICSEIEFDNKLKGQSFPGILDYIKSKDVPKGDITYFNYLIRSQKNIYPLYGMKWDMYNPLGYGSSDKLPYDGVIHADDKYSIYFLAAKPAWLLSGLSHSYYMGIGKDDKIAKECENTIN